MIRPRYDTVTRLDHQCVLMCRKFILLDSTMTSLWYQQHYYLCREEWSHFRFWLDFFLQSSRWVLRSLVFIAKTGLESIILISVRQLEDIGADCLKTLGHEEAVSHFIRLKIICLWPSWSSYSQGAEPRNTWGMPFVALLAVTSTLARSWGWEPCSIASNNQSRLSRKKTDEQAPPCRGRFAEPFIPLFLVFGLMLCMAEHVYRRRAYFCRKDGRKAATYKEMVHFTLCVLKVL
jgi:hypothetical protein